VIEADGVRITLPPGTEGVIVLNIASYGGGSDL
jgi:diacylglycerol kinase (ATP)